MGGYHRPHTGGKQRMLELTRVLITRCRAQSNYLCDTGIELASKQCFPCLLFPHQGLGHLECHECLPGIKHRLRESDDLQRCEGRRGGLAQARAAYVFRPSERPGGQRRHDAGQSHRQLGHSCERALDEHDGRIEERVQGLTQEVQGPVGPSALSGMVSRSREGSCADIAKLVLAPQRIVNINY